MFSLVAKEQLFLADIANRFKDSLNTMSTLESGQLVTVPDDYIDRQVVFWMLWPASRYASPKLRVFIDCMSAHLRT